VHFHRNEKNKGSKNINKAFFFNKNPHLGNNLPFVYELFPDARFIWIYRGLPSVAASLKRILNRNVTGLKKRMRK
jgi:hypothetical protein